jgi:hypothetical protein
MTATVHLEGIGDVPALPDHLHPVAALAAYMAARTWGVVAWAPNTDPELVESGKPNGIVADRLAAAYVPEWGQRVYLVYRCPRAVTVHTRDISHPGHLLGSLPAGADVVGAASGWRHVLADFTGDPGHDTDHNALIFETWRRAHELPADATGEDVLTALAEPLPDRVYLVTYTRLIFEGLHEHAGHRTTPTHRSTPVGGAR